MQFPDHYPEQCPPDDSQPASGAVYHLVEAIPPLPTDCRSWYEQGLECRSKPCQARGLSVYRDIGSVKTMRAAYSRFRKWQIGVADLDPSCGRLKHTPSKLTEGHMTWWAASDVDPRSLIQPCAEEE